MNPDERDIASTLLPMLQTKIRLVTKRAETVAVVDAVMQIDRISRLPRIPLAVTYQGRVYLYAPDFLRIPEVVYLECYSLDIGGIPQSKGASNGV